MAANLAAVLDGSLDVAHFCEPFVTEAEAAGAAVWHAAAGRGVTGYTTFTPTTALLQTKRAEF